MKTILGFLVLSAGSSVIQGSLAIFGDLFNKAFGLKGLVASIEGINGQAMTDLGLGSEIAITSIDHRRINRWWCIRNINASIRTASYAADHR